VTASGKGNLQVKTIDLAIFVKLKEYMRICPEQNEGDFAPV